MNAELLQLEADLRSLGLDVMAEHAGALAEKAARQNESYVAFLHDLLIREMDVRRSRWLKTKLRLSGLPFHKTLGDFDFTFQPSIDERLIRELANLGFIERCENVIFLGPPGVGKTHLSVALAMEALRMHVQVYYTTAHALVDNLRRAHLQGNLKRRLAIYLKPKVLIIDELTYAGFTPEDTHHFFRLVSERYERGSMILVANRSYAEWGHLFQDSVLAGAILDRLLHHAVTVNIRNGNSYRLKDKMRAGTLSTDEASSGRGGGTS